MANSVQRDIHGPDFPLGFIGVTTPGTPVCIMSVVDPTNQWAPTNTAYPYTIRAQQIFFLPQKPGGGSLGTANNVGNVYIVRLPNGAGSGGRLDSGCVIMTLPPGGNPFFLGSAASVRNVFGPYRYYIDADNAGDGVFPTLIIQ
jgi:hypothetical protein